MTSTPIMLSQNSYTSFIALLVHDAHGPRHTPRGAVRRCFRVRMQIAIVLEYMNGGSLGDVLQKVDSLPSNVMIRVQTLTPRI